MAEVSGIDNAVREHYAEVARRAGSCCGPVVSGQEAVADVAADVEAGEDRRADLAAWVGCLAGAQTRAAYRAMLEAAGFTGVSIADSHQVAEGFTSVLVRAGRPEG